MNGDIGPQGEEYTRDQVRSMYRRGLIAVIATAALMMVGVALMAAQYPAVPGPTGKMPNLSDYPLENGASMGRVPCGEAFMEVRSTKKPDEWVVVWYLNKKVLAVVFVYPGYNQAFVDYDFDGRWNYAEISATGAKSAADFYKKVKGCGDGWFQ